MTLNDSWMLLKETIKSSMFQNPFLNRSIFVKDIIKDLKIKKVKRVFKGKPNCLIVITRDQVIRIPLDELSVARCQNNKEILMILSATPFAEFVPKFLQEGVVRGKTYFVESKLNGVAVDVPLSNMNVLVRNAADFITRFHEMTSEEIELDNNNFEKHISRDVLSLGSYFGGGLNIKFQRLEKKLRKQLLNKKLKTVWLHGDYKIENILFDEKKWRVNGLIDWDLSIKKGLPLLDIIFLLIYSNKTLTGESISQALRMRFLKSSFNSFEQEIIRSYLKVVKLSEDVMEPLVVLFWINHVWCRYREMFDLGFSRKKEWLDENVSEIIDEIIENYREHRV